MEIQQLQPYSRVLIKVIAQVKKSQANGQADFFCYEGILLAGATTGC